MRIPVFASLIITSCLIFAGPSFGLDGRLQRDGLELVLKLDDGRILRNEALIGLRLMLAGNQGGMEIQIDGVDEDATATGGPVPLYRLSVSDPRDQSRHNLCQPDPRGRSAGIVLPDGSGGFAFTCTSGAEGKCILMGYRPWEAGDVPQRDLHRACVHMLRADYGGDDRPTTRNGTPIDVYDRFGIQKPDMADRMAFEAAWGPDGAVCVAHVRIAENVSLEELARRYPRLVGHLGSQACSDDVVRSQPEAILFNRSGVTLLSSH